MEKSIFSILLVALFAMSSVSAAAVGSTSSSQSPISTGDRQPQGVPQGVPNSAFHASPQDSETTTPSQVWVSANDGIPSHLIYGNSPSEDYEEGPNSQWQGYPGSEHNPAMNPEHFMLTQNEHPAGHPEYPQQQYPPNYYPEQQQMGVHTGAQQYPTQPQHRPSGGGGLLSTLAEFVGKIF